MQYRILAVFALAATTTFADSTNTLSNTGTQDPNTILITATRTKNSVQNIPGNPVVINSDEIRQGGFTSIPAILNQKAGLHFRNYSDNPGRASVDMRGFGANSHGRVLVMVNGRRINRPDQAPVNWSQIPVGNIDRIEVVRGAHSALYGDFAVGGAINIITRRGTGKPEFEASLTGGSYGFNDESISASGDAGDIGYSTSIGHQSADGYRDRSAYETWSGTLSLETDFSDYLGSWIDYSYIDSDYELPGSLTEAQVRQDRRQSINPDNDAAEQFHNIGFGLGLYPNENNEATIDLGFSRKDIESNFASYSSFNTWGINTYTLSPKYVYSATPFHRENKLTLGVDLSYDDLDVDLYGDRAHTIRNGSSAVGKETAGAYVHNELDILDHLILSGGARVEQAKYSIKERDAFGVVQQDTSDTHKVSAFDVGITFLPVEPLKLFARIDKLYRLPFLDEQISYQGFGSGFNKDLDPETGMSYETGFNLAPSDQLDLSCTLFRMDMKDEIAYVFPSNVNLDKTRHQGVELSGNWQALEHLGLYANYTFQKVEFTAGANKGNEVPLVPQNLLTTGFDAELLDNLHVLTDVTFTDSQFAGGAENNAAGSELDAYTLVDVALRYTLAFKKSEVELFAGIDNLFAEEYSPIAYYSTFSGSIYAYYPAPERTYKAGIKVRF